MAPLTTLVALSRKSVVAPAALALLLTRVGDNLAEIAKILAMRRVLAVSSSFDSHPKNRALETKPSCVRDRKTLGSHAGLSRTWR